MNPEQSSEHVESKLSVWHRVTPFSKYLALVLFIALPFIGGWIGYQYATEQVVVQVETVVPDQVPIVVKQGNASQLLENLLLDKSYGTYRISWKVNEQTRRAFRDKAFLEFKVIPAGESPTYVNPNNVPNIIGDGFKFRNASYRFRLSDTAWSQFVEFDEEYRIVATVSYQPEYTCVPAFPDSPKDCVSSYSDAEKALQQQAEELIFVSEPIVFEADIEEIAFNSLSYDEWLGDEKLIASAPVDCLPSIPDDVRESKLHFYATDEFVEEAKDLIVGERYGEFTYVGYVCRKQPFSDFSELKSAPDLYFVGTTTFVGQQVSDEMFLHYRLQEGDELKLPELARDKGYGYDFYVLSYASEDFPKVSVYSPSFTPDLKITVSAIKVGMYGNAYQTRYGATQPLVTKIETLAE